MKRIVILILALALSMCILVGCGQETPKGFENPGDYLGGGGTGEVAQEVDDSELESVKDAVLINSDLGDLSDNTSQEGAQEVSSTTEIVTISDSGTYHSKANTVG